MDMSSALTITLLRLFFRRVVVGAFQGECPGSKGRYVGTHYVLLRCKQRDGAANRRVYSNGDMCMDLITSWSVLETWVKVAQSSGLQEVEENETHLVH
jgi:hypothetical protein